MSTVRSLNEAVRFYRDGLGMEAGGSAPTTGVPPCISAPRQINLIEQGKAFEPKATVPTPGSADLCFLTAEPVADLKVQLEAAGLLARKRRSSALCA